MKEQDLRKKVQLLLSGISITFRNNVAFAWQGNAKSVPNSSTKIIHNARPIHAGLCVGSSDLIGWTTVEITPEMVGKKVAVFTALELKTGKQNASPEQLNFIKQLKKAGGIAGVVRSAEEAKTTIETTIEQYKE